MAIKPPKWCSDAKPTPIGWVSDRGELLKKMRIPAEQIEEYYRELHAPAEVKQQPQVLTEAPAPQHKLLSKETIRHFWGKISGEK